MPREHLRLLFFFFLLHYLFFAASWLSFLSALFISHSPAPLIFLPMSQIRSYLNKEKKKKWNQHFFFFKLRLTDHIKKKCGSLERVKYSFIFKSDWTLQRIRTITENVMHFYFLLLFYIPWNDVIPTDVFLEICSMQVNTAAKVAPVISGLLNQVLVVLHKPMD